MNSSNKLNLDKSIDEKTLDENNSILEEKDFESKNVKARITMMIDLDLLDKIKSDAKNIGTKYQTLMNTKLREVFLNENYSGELDEIKARLAHLENLIKNKSA